MTSQRDAGTSVPSPNIVWDKSRLHHERASRSNGRAMAVPPNRTRPSSTGAMVTRRMHSHHAAATNGRPAAKSPDSELTMSFDPMKDLHMWTMWRVAVNGRIVDEVRRRNLTQAANNNHLHHNNSSTTHSHNNHNSKSGVGGPTSSRTATTSNGHSSHEGEFNPYGRALVKTPLHRFIRVENGSQDIAGVMMDPHGEGGPHLGTQQFVFYGVPRVVLKKPKSVIRLP